MIHNNTNFNSKCQTFRQTKGLSALLKFVQAYFLRTDKTINNKTWQSPRNPRPNSWRKTANWTSCRATLQANTTWSRSQTTKKVLMSKRDELTSSTRWETLNNQFVNNKNASRPPKTSTMAVARAQLDNGWNSNYALKNPTSILQPLGRMNRTYSNSSTLTIKCHIIQISMRQRSQLYK